MFFLSHSINIANLSNFVSPLFVNSTTRIAILCNAMNIELLATWLHEFLILNFNFYQILDNQDSWSLLCIVWK